MNNQRIPDNTPVLVGAGQYVDRPTEETVPPFQSPMDLAAAAAGARHARDAAAGLELAAGREDRGGVRAQAQVGQPATARTKTPTRFRLRGVRYTASLPNRTPTVGCGTPHP